MRSLDSITFIEIKYLIRLDDIFMRHISFILLCIVCSTGILWAQKEKGYFKKIKAERVAKNKQFKDAELGSPLSDKQIKTFKQLNYFPVDTTYRVKAKLLKNEKQEIFTFKTTDKRKRDYIKYGTLEFEIEGQKQRLTVYKGIKRVSFIRPSTDSSKKSTLKIFQDRLFLPFRDLTTGNETYGGGRYLELLAPKGQDLILDFNLVYNPYCAYRNDFSCPIPPPENTLEVAIRAGEKKFKK